MRDDLTDNMSGDQIWEGFEDYQVGDLENNPVDKWVMYYIFVFVKTIQFFCLAGREGGKIEIGQKGHFTFPRKDTVGLNLSNGHRNYIAKKELFERQRRAAFLCVNWCSTEARQEERLHRLMNLRNPA